MLGFRGRIAVDEDRMREASVDEEAADDNDDDAPMALTFSSELYLVTRDSKRFAYSFSTLPRSMRNCATEIKNNIDMMCNRHMHHNDVPV